MDLPNTSGQSAKALELAERSVAISPGPFELHSLATVYDKNGRCAEAVVQEERAVEALPDRVDASIPAAFRARLAQIAATCGKGDVIGTKVHSVEAEPVLRIVDGKPRRVQLNLTLDAFLH